MRAKFKKKKSSLAAESREPLETVTGKTIQQCMMMLVSLPLLNMKLQPIRSCSMISVRIIFYIFGIIWVKELSHADCLWLDMVI